MTPEDTAYIAGLLEGEGCFYLAANTYHRQSNGQRACRACNGARGKAFHSSKVARGLANAA